MSLWVIEGNHIPSIPRIYFTNSTYHIPLDVIFRILFFDLMLIFLTNFSGGVPVSDKSRNKTPGGVFFGLIQEKVRTGEVAKDDWTYIRAVNLNYFNY